MGLGQELTKAIYSTKDGTTPAILGRIDASTINEANFAGVTPLQAAGWMNNVEVVDKLLSIPGINVNARNIRGWTAIMLAARYCRKATLQALLDHPAVDLDVKDNDGRGLEDIVGDQLKYAPELTMKNKCLKLIQEARTKKETVRLEQDQAKNVNDFSESGNSLEEMKTKVRKAYVDKIDEVNQKVQEHEKLLKNTIKRRRIEEKNLEEKQYFESYPKKMKLEEKKNKLEQELADIQDEIKKHDEEMKIKHKQEKVILDDNFDKEHEEVRQQLCSLKEMSNKLAKELKKQDIDPDDDASANLEAARDTLECPICMEMMRPPTKIFMCPSSHLVCEACKDKLEGRLCPTCRTEGVTLRALMAENFARTLFNNQKKKCE